MVVDFIAGLGGREVNKNTVATVVGKARQIADDGRPLDEPMWIDLNCDILP
jgi:hypothetical protein